MNQNLTSCGNKFYLRRTFLSCLLAVLMIVSLLPASALTARAEDGLAYTITLVTGDPGYMYDEYGTPVLQKTIQSDGSAVVLDTPIYPEGYTFTGWFIDPTCTMQAAYDANMMFVPAEQNTVLYAGCTAPVVETVAKTVPESAEETVPESEQLPIMEEPEQELVEEPVEEPEQEPVEEPEQAPAEEPKQEPAEELDQVPLEEEISESEQVFEQNQVMDPESELTLETAPVEARIQMNPVVNAIQQMPEVQDAEEEQDTLLQNGEGETGGTESSEEQYLWNISTELVLGDDDFINAEQTVYFPNSEFY